ncbi:hypothetical protein [Streptomyces sp. NPDC058985]|uniref:hypothetical protein n=1 Tax=Streptomyces sp. NPDC058985 TaxID=3346684 RepID=UPI0036C0CE3A
MLLAFIIAVRLRRRLHARSRNDEKPPALIILVHGILVAPTAYGEAVLDVVEQLAAGINPLRPLRA